MGARGWLEMDGEKKSLEISELGCADGCGRRGCWKWLGRRRMRSASLAARTAADGVGASEWLEMGGGKKPLGMSELGCEEAADGVGARGWPEMDGEKKSLEISELGCADGCGRRGCWKWLGRRRNRWRSASLAARTAADGVGAREWVEMGWEKKPLGMSELGCADGMGQENGWGKKA